MAKQSLKLISWNVNGLRAVMKKGFVEILGQMNGDVFAIQETKLQEHQLTPEMTHIGDYAAYWSHATVKKGYSGVGTYTRLEPEHVSYGLGQAMYDDEGRIIEMDFGQFVFFNVYFPNGQMSAERLQYKLDFYECFLEHTEAYRRQGRSLVISGDFNTAHNEIDLKHPKANQKTSGFLRIERDWLDRLVNLGYVDTFRHFFPEEVKYSWWTYRFNARKKNVGWRIDYFFVTGDMIEKGWVKDAMIYNSVLGSDHCPVGISLEL